MLGTNVSFPTIFLSVPSLDLGGLRLLPICWPKIRATFSLQHLWIKKHLLSSAASIVGTQSIHPISLADGFQSPRGDYLYLLQGTLRLLLCSTKQSFQLMSLIASNQSRDVVLS